VVVSGDVEGADAFNSSPSSVVAIVLAHLQPGSIIVLHLQGAPNAPATAAAIDPLIGAVRARGLRFVTVSELLSSQFNSGSSSRIQYAIDAG